MPIVITGLKELRAELKAAEFAAPREVNAALKVGADEVTALARSLAPKKSGKMAASLRSYSTARSAGIRSNHPGAGVQEYATTYYRQPAGQGGTTSRATKSHIRKGHMSASEGGMIEVHMINVSALGPSGGRFAWKAVDQLAPVLVEETFERLLNILALHGWFG